LLLLILIAILLLNYNSLAICGGGGGFRGFLCSWGGGRCGVLLILFVAAVVLNHNALALLSLGGGGRRLLGWCGGRLGCLLLHSCLGLSVPITVIPQPLAPLTKVIALSRSHELSRNVEGIRQYSWKLTLGQLLGDCLNVSQDLFIVRNMLEDCVEVFECLLQFPLRLQSGPSSMERLHILRLQLQGGRSISSRKIELLQFQICRGSIPQHRSTLGLDLQTLAEQ